MWSLALGVLGFLVGLYISRWQKQIDRHTDLLRERRQSYREYLVELEDFLMSEMGDDEGDKRQRLVHLKKKEDALLLASDHVIGRIRFLQSELQDFNDPHTETSVERIFNARENVIAEMRRDCFSFSVVPFPFDKSFQAYIYRKIR